MKQFLVFVAVLACVYAYPTTKFYLPRLPLSVLLRGKYQMIPEDKIVGGEEVVPNSLPFQVSLNRRGVLASSAFSHSCGGSILDASTILNAAHCVDGINNLARFRVIAGEHSLSITSGLEQTSDVSGVVMHENYNSATNENDIALIFLTTPLDLSKPEVKAVVLPKPTSEYDPSNGTIVTVSGWGTTTQGGNLSDVLLSVDIPVVSDDDCADAYGADSIFPSMLCAGDMNSGGIYSCQGDSGGPLFTANGDGTFVQHGIVSWGTGCAQVAYPGVYTQVSYFLDWIATNRV